MLSETKVFKKDVIFKKKKISKKEILSITIDKDIQITHDIFSKRISVLLTRDIKIRNLSTNLGNPGKSLPIAAKLQNGEFSKFSSCLFRKLTKLYSSDQEGSVMPQYLLDNKKKKRINSPLSSME